MEIILGSHSPRRRELMAGLDLPFTAITIDADETYPADLQAGDIPYYISRAKARAYEPNLTDEQLLITADTIGGDKRIDKMERQIKRLERRLER